LQDLGHPFGLALPAGIRARLAPGLAFEVIAQQVQPLLVGQLHFDPQAVAAKRTGVARAVENVCLGGIPLRFSKMSG